MSFSNDSKRTDVPAGLPAEPPKLLILSEFTPKNQLLITCSLPYVLLRTRL